MNKNCINTEKINIFIQKNKNWSLKNNKLYQEFMFKNFLEAFEFMQQVAIFAEQINHHPEWFNVYKRVEVSLTTHEAGGITHLDFELAKKMEEVALKIYNK